MSGGPAGPIFYINIWHAGLYPEVITRVKFQVDSTNHWSKDLESMVTKTRCFTVVLPMNKKINIILPYLIFYDRRPYNSVTHHHDTL